MKSSSGMNVSPLVIKQKYQTSLMSPFSALYYKELYYKTSGEVVENGQTCCIPVRLSDTTQTQKYQQVLLKLFFEVQLFLLSALLTDFVFLTHPPPSSSSVLLLSFSLGLSPLCLRRKSRYDSCLISSFWCTLWLVHRYCSCSCYVNTDCLGNYVFLFVYTNLSKKHCSHRVRNTSWMRDIRWYCCIYRGTNTHHQVYTLTNNSTKGKDLAIGYLHETLHA